MNNVISNHTVAANIIGLALVASVTSISFAAIAYSGDLAKTAYGAPLVSVQTTSSNGTSMQFAGPVNLQGQLSDMAVQLQPAASIANVQSAPNTLQNVDNSLQLSSVSVQNTVGAL